MGVHQIARYNQVPQRTYVAPTYAPPAYQPAAPAPGYQADAFQQAAAAITSLTQQFARPQAMPQATTAGYPQLPGFLQPAAVAPMTAAQPNTAVQAQIQALMQQVVTIQQQINQVLASASPAAAPFNTYAPPPPPPAPAPLPAPAPAPVAPPPVPQPYYQQPTYQQPVTVQSLPPANQPIVAAPVTPVTPAPAPQAPAAVFNFPGLRAGSRLAVANGTQVKGYSIGGDAVVNSIDGKSLDITVNASAAFGLVQMKIGLRAEAQADGTVRIVANELDKSTGRPKKALFDDKLQVVDSSAGRLTLRDPQGRAGSITVGADGSVTLDHPEGHLVLNNAGGNQYA